MLHERPEYSEGEMQSVEKKHKHFTAMGIRKKIRRQFYFYFCRRKR